MAGTKKISKRVARPPPRAHDQTHPLPEERALFLHLIRTLAREAARADHGAVSTTDDTDP